ncbi:MAG: lysylphosphatidylglycerol synthase transmembrane domain-containing protein [bacterium]|nr:lysylphosphatidylglycerol synthase transmembrane domain-containing protein [bacterium]
MKNIIKKYSFVLGIIIFLIVISKTNLGEILKNIEKIKPIYLLGGALLTIPSIFTKAICWNYIKRQQGIKYNLKNSFLMYCSGLYIGLVTPGRLGELTKALYLKKDGYSMGKSLVSVVLDRLSDFVFLLFFMFLGSVFFFAIFQKTILIPVLFIIITIALFLIFLKIGLIKWALNKMFYFFVPLKYQKSWKINSQDFINDFKIYNLKNYIIIFLITVFSWVFYYLQMYLLASGIGLNVPFLYLAISVTIAGFITLIPVSVSGIGTRDAALIMLFSPFLIAKEQIIAFSALILLMVIWGALIGLFCWLLKPIKL